MDRRPYSAWEQDNSGPRQWARERVREILRHHQPTPLDPQLAQELEKIIQFAQTSNR
jgi:trimethylamine:corrinoid methyltransferase-like protein